MDIAIRDGRMYNWCVKISGNKSNPLYRIRPKNAMFLRQKLTASTEEIERLTAELTGKTEEITRIQSDYIEYIKRMNAELNTCHQQMHEIERYYADRIAELQDELNRR